MAINKDKNVSILITMDKKLAEALETFIDSMNENLNADLTKSKILSSALILYLQYMHDEVLVKVKENKGGIKNDNHRTN